MADFLCALCVLLTASAVPLWAVFDRLSRSARLCGSICVAGAAAGGVWGLGRGFRG